MLKVILSHLKHISAIGKEDIATFTVFCHILEFTLLEGFQLFGVIALYPTSLIQTDRLPTINWSMPLFNCLVFIGSAFSMYLNISGEKLGKPLK